MCLEFHVTQPRHMNNFSPRISLFSRFHARRFEEGKNSRKVKFFNKSESQRERRNKCRLLGRQVTEPLYRVFGEICVEEQKQKNIRMKNRQRGREREKRKNIHCIPFNENCRPLGLNSEGEKTRFHISSV